MAIVEEPCLLLLDGVASTYELANSAIVSGEEFSRCAALRKGRGSLDYDEAYAGRSGWKLLPPFDHPHETARCVISGTGLTHLGSAQGRDSMHSTTTASTAAAAKAAEPVTDSMKMFHWGIADGRPASGSIGIAPEWFYKGTGANLRAHGEALEIPAYAEDGGEEAEVAGIYLIAENGQPYRVGFANGNEFSDHQFEKENYLNLAGSKLRTCGLGPELVIDPQFDEIPVHVQIERAGKPIWAKEFRSGEQAMCHSLQNIEHHHFKFEGHRSPGDVHIHFFGTAALSFGDGVRLEEGDVMQVRIEGFGRALRNPVAVAHTQQNLVSVISLK